MVCQYLTQFKSAAPIKSINRGWPDPVSISNHTARPEGLLRTPGDKTAYVIAGVRPVRFQYTLGTDHVGRDQLHSTAKKKCDFINRREPIRDAWSQVARSMTVRSARGNMLSMKRSSVTYFGETAMNALVMEERPIMEALSHHILLKLCATQKAFAMASLEYRLPIQ